MPDHADTYNNIESRVGRMEGSVLSLTNDVRDLAASVGKLSDSVNQFKEGILGKFSQASKPQWSIIISLGTMLIAVFTLGGGILAVMMNGQGERITRHDTNIEAMREWQLSHAEKNAEHIAELDANIKTMKCFATGFNKNNNAFDK